MSISAPDPPAPPLDIQLSALAAYGGLPGAIAAVGFWPRALARIIDTVVHFFASFFAGLLFTIMLVIAGGGHVSPLILAKLQPITVLSFVLSLVGSIAYHTLCEGLHGSSLGKLMLSLVVVQENGAPCRLGSALIRSAAYFVDSLFFGVVGYVAMQRTSQQQRYGDDWAHTIVCKRENAPAGTLRTGGRFLAALFVAILIDIALAMVGLLAKVVG
jgi:uncharacterized RDD family membrane protein YckC